MGDILGELSSKFKVHLIFLDTQGNLLFNIGTESTESATDSDFLRRQGIMQAKVPIHFLADEIGSLVVCSPLHNNDEVASVIAFCLENFLKFETEIEDLSSEVVRVYEELSLLYSITNRLGSEMDVDSICQRVLEETDRVLLAHNTSIMLLDHDKNELYTRKSIGRNAEAARNFTADVSTGLIGHVLQQCDPTTVCDIDADGRISLPYPAKSILCVPLITDDKIIGLLLASDKLSGEEFWSRELKLMGMFASEVATAIRKAQLYEAISTTFINTVKAFSSAIDAKDPYTYGHSRRVAQLSVIICEELGMSKNETRLVELAAFMHDIGKIGTPESILHKPGKLEPEELEKIKEHPAKGAEILSNIAEFSEIIKWIKHHHEWYDGKGYPDQIAAEDIPIEARILTIADAYDAMTSDRPYRKAIPMKEVVMIMSEFTRSQFDPDILSVFNRLLNEGRINPKDC
jgi:putative nucleotidyltransferase with HDIG domain